MDTWKESIKNLIRAMESETPTLLDESDLKKLTSQPLPFPSDSDANNLEAHCMNIAGLLYLFLSMEPSWLFLRGAGRSTVVYASQAVPDRMFS
jgi:hypothetical protein